MKFSRMLLWSALLVAVVPQAWAQANSVPSQPHLLVKGDASRKVMPDRFVVKVALESVDMQTDIARRKVQVNAERIAALFATHGAIAETVRMDNLSIAPSTRYKNDEEVFQGTAVSRDMEGAFETPERLQAFLAELKASSEVQVRTATPVYSGEARLRAELKAEAAAQTRTSAKGLADAYGAKIIGLYTISDVAPSFAYGVQAGSWPSANGARDFYERGDSLDRVQVSGSRVAVSPLPAPGELLTAAPITYTENVYAIFLISDGN
ncbi:DUF541 domain-containing protein [Stenotrophomonas sp. MYb238]|uniref:SIMPL domain-containing protein n=1 Tax=Stenotrophomonas sp. MYb238 TaxID=2040281 RepID=UPI0012912E82|nr:SIMPL domain-containing protein [Stenotrophomonas sp. MYb238]MQP74383.1 DUF541 domain-containing protein [Stenotrophomonas sp. MYb238]